MLFQDKLKLDGRVKDYFIEQIRKQCGDDFKLIEDRIDGILIMGSLKDSIRSARSLIALRKLRLR